MTKSRLKKIANNNKITHCYIYKDGYYYRPNASGYVEFITEAGIYEKANALEQAYCCDDLILIPIDTMKHNKLIIEKVKDLTSRLI